MVLKPYSHYETTKASTAHTPGPRTGYAAYTSKPAQSLCDLIQQANAFGFRVDFGQRISADGSKNIVLTYFLTHETHDEIKLFGGSELRIFLNGYSLGYRAGAVS